MNTKHTPAPIKLKMVLGFMFNEKETDILLIEKKTPKWQYGKFNGIGGKLKDLESPNEAMIREFYEETNIFYDSWVHVITMQGEDWIVDVFTTKTDKVFEYQTVTEENLNLIPISDLDDYEHIDNLRWLIPLCLDKNTSITKPNYSICNNVKPFAAAPELLEQEIKNLEFLKWIAGKARDFNMWSDKVQELHERISKTELAIKKATE